MMGLQATLNSIINKKNTFSKVKDLILMSYIVLETLYKTIFGMFFYLEIERFQCVIAILLICILAIKFISLDAASKNIWLKNNSLVFGYFVVRLITFIYTGLEYTMLRSMIFEVVYLLVLTELIVDTHLFKNLIVKFLVIVNFILNLITVTVYIMCKIFIEAGTHMTNPVFQFLVNYTYVDVYYDGYWIVYNSCMYSNPNFMGMMTGISMLMVINFWSKELSCGKKAIYIGYCIFSMCCIIISGCSSAIVALVVALVAVIIVKKTKISREIIIYIVLICSIVGSGIIYAYAGINSDNESFSEMEVKLDQISTTRYSIWKDIYSSHQEELLLGCGNITLEKRDRYQYNLDKGIDKGLDVNGSLIEYAGPHNGYLGMLSCTGIIGSLMFLALFLKRIHNSSIINDRYWFLVVVFITIINIFECMIIVNKNFCCLYLFLLLAVRENELVDR